MKERNWWGMNWLKRDEGEECEKNELNTEGWERERVLDEGWIE